MAGAVAKWLQLVANMIVVGTCVFFVIASYDKAAFHYALLDRLERALPWLVAAVAVFLLVELATKTAEITDVTENAWNPSSWLEIIKNTWLGKVWAVRMFLVLMLLPIAIYVAGAPSARWRYLLCAAVAGAALMAAAFSGHPAAEDSPVLAITPYAIHMVMAGIWFGGLPAFLAIVYSMARSRDKRERDPAGMRAIARFSVMALPVMLVIIVTGLLLMDRQVGERYAALVATDYGWFLVVKLLLLSAILAIAGYARFVWLPALEAGKPQRTATWRRLRTGVSVEFVLAALVVLAATLCASSIPAKHAVIEHWPYPFRFSFAAAWELPETGTNLLIAGLLCAAAVALGYGLARSGPSWRRSVLSATLAFAVFGIGFALYSISTKASVDTYRDSAVPFDAISIAQGESLFAANCTPCHGLQAKGDGPLAASLPKRPVDLLTEPHTSKHLAGDFYNWIGTGIPESGMPGFGDRLSEDDRWDIVNFLHLGSRGYESRALRTRVVPDLPWKNLGAPDFSFTDQNGETHTLKDYRKKQSVLLVFFSWPDQQQRLDALRSEYDAIRDRGTEIIAVPWRGTPDARWAREMPFPVVDGGSEIGRTYAAFRRSIADPDLFGPGKTPDHMELLVDRFGYLRGRWLPDQDGAGWSDSSFLAAQLDQMKREKEILPPPGDHVH